MIIWLKERVKNMNDILAADTVYEADIKLYQSKEKGRNVIIV